MRWLLDAPGVSGIFNVGTGRAASFRELITAMFRALGRAANIESIDMPPAIRGQYQSPILVQWRPAKARERRVDVAIVELSCEPVSSVVTVPCPIEMCR